MLNGAPDQTAYDIVREYWILRTDSRRPTGPGRSRSRQNDDTEETEPTPAFEAAWRQWLHDGVVPATAFTPRSVA